MKDDEYEKMYAAESRFWWFAGKGFLVRDWAWRFSGDGHGLDVGCGTGINLDRLQVRGAWTGLDSNRKALRFCAGRGNSRLVAGRAEELPFAEGSFDCAVALDLFEHLEEDAAAARETCRVLRPGGTMIATVPAHPALWGVHDLAMGHVRRYDKNMLRALLEGAGLEIERITHFMGLLFPAMLVVKLWQKRFGSRTRTLSYEWPGCINRALLWVVGVEVKLLQRLDMPAGTTLAAVARKPGP